jgi:hypothetical protein
MACLGGNVFTEFSVPLVFNDRYFILEPGNPQLLTVVSENDGEPYFEVFKNEPRENPLSEVIKSTPGVVTVSPKSESSLLYRVHPGSETRIAFVKPGGGEMTARITEGAIQVEGITLRNNTFIGDMTGVSLMPDGGVSIGARIPWRVMEWLRNWSTAE